MRFPEWEQDKVRWDRYKEFHIGIGVCGFEATDWRYPPFVLFRKRQRVECMRSRPAPFERVEYPLLGVSLVATEDSWCPQLYFADGEPVRKAWLNDNGQQYLLIDHDSHRAVRLGPVKFKNPGAPPVGVSIAIRKPFRSLPKEARQYVDDFVCAAKAAMTLMDHPASKLKEYTSTSYAWNASTQSPVAVPYKHYESLPSSKLSLERILAVKSWQELEEKELKRLFFAGVDKRPRELVECLFTKRR